MEFQAVTLAYLRGMLFSHNDCFIVVSENGIFIYYQALQPGSALFEKKKYSISITPWPLYSRERQGNPTPGIIFFSEYNEVTKYSVAVAIQWRASIEDDWEQGTKEKVKLYAF